MNSVGMESTAVCHVVAMPFPGRGHINPMMNFCKLLASRKHDILITFVVTEEWLGYIGSEPRPDSVRLVTIPNVIPPESLKAVDFPGFYEAVMTKMEAPFEQLLDQIEIPVTAIIGDIEVRWAISLGSRRNIPVAAFWTMSATFLSMLYHFNLSNQNQKSPTSLLGQVDYIPGISSSDLAELQKVFQKTDQRVFQLALECISKVPQAQYLLFTSVYELEPLVMDTMKDTFQFPVYPIGPAIPYSELEGNFSGTNDSHMVPEYLQWLDSQPKGSVLYISLGSFLSVSSTQMDEIFAGLQDSGVRFLWVARGEASRLKDTWSDDRGLVLPWCDQLKVLCHSSIDGFWTHCGWNSTLEAVFAGVPMLTFPLFLDQDPNSKQILEDWRIGREVRRGGTEENLLTRQEIAKLVQKFMDLESNEGEEMRRRARELGNICQQAIAEGGSSTTNLDAFIRDISLGVRH
uniref:Glycosyltransferase n=1 Tax=Salix viminalis TaxID=40686 RepID=A0A6N2LXN6_SALVM